MATFLNRLFRRHKPGDPVHKICDTKALNMVYSILEDIQGVNCRIEKPIENEGRGWKIVVDGSSDIRPPDELTPPWGNAIGVTENYPWKVYLDDDDENYMMTPGVALLQFGKKIRFTQDISWGGSRLYRNRVIYVDVSADLKNLGAPTYTVAINTLTNIGSTRWRGFDDANFVARVPIALVEDETITQLTRGLLYINVSTAGTSAITGYDISYSTSTGKLTKTPLYGLVDEDFTPENTPSPEDVFTAVDEEI